MSINYFKKLGKSSPNDFALYLENYYLEKMGREKVTKANQYACGKFFSIKDADKNNYAYEIILSKEMGDDYILIERIEPHLYCNDFVVKDLKGDRWDYSKLLANFMLENLKGEDKVNYINDFKKIWQKRFELDYENAKNNLNEKVGELKNIIDHNKGLEDDLSA